MSGIDAPQPWHLHAGTNEWPPQLVDWPNKRERYKPPATPPPNGTRSPCPICRCKPGEPHKQERPSLHAHSYAYDPDDTALD